MIQRIQTFYLFIAELLVTAMFFIPLANLMGNDGTKYQFNLTEFLQESNTVSILQKNWMLVCLVVLSMLLILIAIFQYKNRKRQVQISLISILPLLFSSILIYYYAWFEAIVPGQKFSTNYSATFPIIATIFIILAINGIRKDENLVKSIDRIR